jgi:prepilin-type N-terminal cleavage/methylation domain-containing protein
LTTGRRNSNLGGRGHPIPVGTSAGLTLLELILVLVLISITLAMASPSLGGFFASRQTADAAMRVVSLTQWARSEAVARGQRCRLNIDPQGRTCWVTVQRTGVFAPADGQRGRPVQLPEGARVSLRSTSADPSPSYVQFYPSGRSDTATIEITGRKGEVFLVASASPTDPFRVISPAEATKP